MNLSNSDLKSILDEIDCRAYWDKRDHDLHHQNPEYEDNIRVYAITEACQGCVVALNSAYNLLSKSDYKKLKAVWRRKSDCERLEFKGMKIYPISLGETLCQEE